MNKLKNIFVLVFALTSFIALGQDKVVFKDGRRLKCKIVAINPSTVTFKDSTEKLTTIAKNDLLIAEYSSGSIYIFGNTAASPTFSTPINKPRDKKADIREKEKNFSDNIIGIQIPDIFMGRLTLSYERLFFEKQMGIAVPVSMTYDPNVIYSGLSTDTSMKASKVRKNVSFVTGVDLNYYFESRSHTKFFVGPRFRYGTDVALGNITAYSVQFQNGFLICSSNGKMASTFALGFGFARILASPVGNGINPNQSYPWASFTFRLGFRA